MDNFVTCKKTGRECKHLRTEDGSGCICDLKQFSKAKSDWNIARFIGVATYGQLLDAAPGLFEDFPDFRSDGNSASSITQISGIDTFPGGGMINCDSNNKYFKENISPPPPNLVSTILIDGLISPAEMKRCLIRAAMGHVPTDPRIEPILHSSKSYESPELSLGEIFQFFIIYSIFITVLLSFLVIAKR